jgi:NAD(P)-dependent dehydrogenase (short-subunit alcohol dehydrogenase family)
MNVLDRFSLAGKVALVTGASSGLGAGFAVALAQAATQVMPPGSGVVNIASVLGLIKSFWPQAAYAASKAGH